MERHLLEVASALTRSRRPVLDNDDKGWFFGGTTPPSSRGPPGGNFTDKVSDAEFKRHVWSVFQIMTSQPRYGLGVAFQVPPTAWSGAFVRTDLLQ